MNAGAFAILVTFASLFIVAGVLGVIYSLPRR